MCGKRPVKNALMEEVLEELQSLETQEKFRELLESVPEECVPTALEQAFISAVDVLNRELAHFSEVGGCTGSTRMSNAMSNFRDVVESLGESHPIYQSAMQVAEQSINDYYGAGWRNRAEGERILSQGPSAILGNSIFSYYGGPWSPSLVSKWMDEMVASICPDEKNSHGHQDA